MEVINKKLWSKFLKEEFDNFCKTTPYKLPEESENKTLNDILHNNPIKTDIVYTGEFYTIAQSEINIEVNGKLKKIVAEGIARRSSKDIPNPSLGNAIAIGRAIDALKRKLKSKGNEFYKRKNGRKTKDLMKA